MLVGANAVDADTARKLKAEKDRALREKIKADPRGAHRQRLTREAKEYERRAGIMYRPDYEQRRKDLALGNRDFYPNRSKPVNHVEGRKVKENEDVAFWERLLAAEDKSLSVITAVPTKSPTPEGTDAPTPDGGVTSPPVGPAPTAAPVETPDDEPTAAPVDTPDEPTPVPDSGTDPPTPVPEEPTTAPPVTVGTPAPTPTVGTPAPTPTVVEPTTPQPVGTSTPAPTPPSVPPVDPTPAPVGVTTDPPTPSATCPLEPIISPVALPGTNLNNITTYQGMAYDWLCKSNFAGLSDARIIQRYALACLYFATHAVMTIFTDAAFGEGNILPWQVSTNWVTDADECTWARLACDGNGMVTTIDLVSRLELVALNLWSPFICTANHDVALLV